MNREYRNIDELLKRRLPSTSKDHMEWKAARVLDRLRAENEWDQTRADLPATATPAPPASLKWRQFALVSVAASVLLLVLIVAPRKDAFAVVESVGGNLSAIHDGDKRALRGGEHVAANESIRSGGGAASAIRLADGSRIEMRSDSELSVQDGADGPRILLNEGDIIVSASRERAGNLYVQTRDVTVAVRGTTFLVNAEEDGSRVAVIEGEAHVQQGPALKKLLPGEQIATGLSAEPVSVAQQISWSRHAPTHLELLERHVETLRRTEASVTSPPSQAAQTPSFEVASIRRNNDPTCRQFLCGITTQPRSGRLIIQNQNLLSIIKTAYGVRPEIILGGPDWRDKDKFDIEAKAERPVSDEAALFVMLRSLLAERFKLVIHREMREMPMYTLVVGKNSSKLQKAREDGPAISLRAPAGGGGRGGCGATGNGNVGSLQRLGDAVTYAAGVRQFAGRASMPQLANFLSMFMGCRPVLDKTDLPGAFDLRVEWTVSPQELFFPGDPDPAMISALADQVGIKLEIEKALGEVLVVDSAQPPTEN
jgi:uncharacterized protein (TIGR03435 family)